MASPILHVEDDENDVFLMQRAFKLAGVRNQLLVARNGEEAIKIFRDREEDARPCLLITDIKMPRVDGLELLLWLRMRPEFDDMPKLVISSSALEADLTKSLLLGAKAYFIKPNDLEGLVALVQEWSKTYLSRTWENARSKT